MIKPRHRQSGSILLALMLVMIVAASFTLISKLNESSRTFVRRQSTIQTLQQAKAALISYAVTYPEGSSNPTAGPGILPCPAVITDTGNLKDPANGKALGNCSLVGGTTTGRLPWRTLNSGFLADDSGEVPWYVVTDKYRTPPPGPVNSDTPGGLSVDGTGDIVAVIIAPGAPLSQPPQNRAAANVNNVSEYLEGENADGDTAFSRYSGGNDILVYITRQELMQVVEKRVLRDISNMMQGYRQEVGVYPWLAPFNPTATDHDSTVNVREGYIAYNDINEVFPTKFTISWKITSGGDGSPFTMTPTTTMPDWNDFSPITVDQATPASVTGSPECTWTTLNEFTCDGRYSETTSINDGGSPWEKHGTLTRDYDFYIYLPSGGVVNHSSGTNEVRTRSYDIASAPLPSGTTLKIQITSTETYDTKCQVVTGTCNPISPPEVTTDTQTNTITTATVADVTLTGVTYDFGVGDEIPQWFISNNWHKLALIAYSAGYVPGSSTPSCNPGGLPSPPACLTLQGMAAPVNDKQAIVIMAGPALSGQDRVTSPTITDYFENQNKTQNDDIFDMAPVSTTFNDMARAIAP